MTALQSDIEHLAPEPDTVTLTSGLVLRLQPLKTRQLFKLMRIMTRPGNGVLISTLVESMTSGKSVDIAGELIGAMLVAIPESEDEVLAFIRSMIDFPDRGPVDKQGNPLTDEGRAAAAETSEIAQAIFNPLPEDLLLLLEGIFNAEKDHLESLGNQLRRLLATSQKTGVIPNLPDSSEPTPEPST